MTRALLSLLLLTSLAHVARAEDGPTHTAASVAAAPRPDDAQNLRVGESRVGETLAWIPRVILFVPRYAVELAFLPVRGGLWGYERFQIRDRLRGFFFNEAGTFGVFPTAFFETGFGLNVGGRLVHKDLFGGGETLRLRAGFGGRFLQSYSGRLGSGRRFGDHFRLTLRGDYHIRPQERFFGFGNGDLVDASAVALPVDPLAADVAVSTRFRERLGRVEAAASMRVAGRLWSRVTGAFLRRTFADADDPRGGDLTITDAYQPMGLVGFLDGVSTLYAELELDYDTRSVASPFFSEALPSRGWRLTGFLGYSNVLSEESLWFVRWGFDVQRYFDLYAHNRILVLRFYAEGVTNDRDEVPFVDLPHLGGDDFLRGYTHGRFRDRIAAVGQAEYAWDLGRSFAGFLFTDVGRVWRQLDDVAPRDLRVGFGGGFQAHSLKNFIFRAQLSSSMDGGLYLSLVLSPLYQLEEREDRF